MAGFAVFAKEVFAPGKPGAVILYLFVIAVMSWLIEYIGGIFNPRVARLINMVVLFVAIGLAIGSFTGVLNSVFTLAGYGGK